MNLKHENWPAFPSAASLTLNSVLLQVCQWPKKNRIMIVEYILNSITKWLTGQR